MSSASSAPPKKSSRRVSILVTRWWQGEGNGIDGQSTERVALPLAQIRRAAPYTQEIWASLAESRREVGTVRARIDLAGDDYLYVTETVEAIDALMNTPIGAADSAVGAALMVLITTPHIREYLAAHDPKALGQAIRAFEAR